MNYKIIAKYIKNLEFKIPSPKTFFLLSKNISNYKIKIDIKSNQIKEKIIEVETTLSLSPTKKDFEEIKTHIVYSAVIELDGEISNKKKLEEIILIKVPEEVYADIRESFIFVFEKSGFKNIKVDEKVDFRKLYELNRVQ
jgi:preprotein translocase subunit SecB|tara:strand:+ start:90 stop:509 length:420 start_codon:yes stop_codon:yes gene_type:complete